MTHQVYKARIVGELEDFLFAVSKQRMLSLKPEIESGYKLIVPESLVLLYDNLNRNDARELSGGKEL